LAQVLGGRRQQRGHGTVEYTLIQILVSIVVIVILFYCGNQIQNVLSTWWTPWAETACADASTGCQASEGGWDPHAPGGALAMSISITHPFATPQNAARKQSVRSQSGESSQGGNGYFALAESLFGAMGVERGDGFNHWLVQEPQARLGSIPASGPLPERAPFHAVQLQVPLLAKVVARRSSVISEPHERKMLLAEFAPRELDVLRLLAEGLDTATMAQRLGIAPHTVEWNVKHVIEKLRVHSKLQAVIEAARKGLIEL
jgi:DNA-binding CsgD family transcriptional regulator/Flp pilus assembly pilin Flp